MLEKGKKYTYEELKEIILDANVKILQELNDKSNTDINDPTTRTIFQMQNMMIVNLFARTLLKDDDE